MKKKRNPFKRADLQIRRFCRRLPPRRRIILLSTTSFLFLSCCLYSITTSIAGFGEEGRSLQIDHIRPLVLQSGKDTHTETKENYDNGHTENQDTVRFVG